MIRFALMLLMSLALSSQAVAAVNWNNSNSKQSGSSDWTSFITKEFPKSYYESFPEIEFAKSELRDLKIPQDWKLFEDNLELGRFYDTYREGIHEKYLVMGWGLGKAIETPKVIGECVSYLQKQDLTLKDLGRPFTNFKCLQILTFHNWRNPSEFNNFKSVLSYWAEHKNVHYVTDWFGHNSGSDNMVATDRAYSVLNAVGDLSAFYALHYDKFDFTNEERKKVDEYLSWWLINHDLEPMKGLKRCPLEKPKAWERKKLNFWPDNCGSNRWRMAQGALLLGLRTNNQKLFEAGNRHTEIALANIDENGINANWARKGFAALSYTRQLPNVLTVLTEIYDSVGYDFLEHQTPHGKKIHQVYETFFKIIYEPDLMHKYAKTQPLYGGQTADDFEGLVREYSRFRKLSLEEKWRQELIQLDALVQISKPYVLRYRPDLSKYLGYQETWARDPGNEHVAVFTTLTPLAIHEARAGNVSKLLEQERVRIIAEEKAKKEEEQRVINARIAANKKRLKDRANEIRQREKDILSEYDNGLFNFPYELKDGKYELINNGFKFIETDNPDDSFKQVSDEKTIFIVGKIKRENFNPVSAGFISGAEKKAFSKFRVLVSLIKKGEHVYLGYKASDFRHPHFTDLVSSVNKTCRTLSNFRPEDWIIIPINTNLKSDIDFTTQCAKDVFAQGSEDDFRFYMLLIKSAKSISTYVNNH